MITITDKEKQYLLSIDAKQFVEGLYSKSIFYELLQTDIATSYSFSIVSVLSVYNFVLNVIHSNVFEALNLRHSKFVGGRPLKIYSNASIYIMVEPEDDRWEFCNKYFKKTYNYTISNRSLAIHSHLRFTINDELYLKETVNTVHLFKINIDNVGEFISKMLILYNDFIDNIPI